MKDVRKTPERHCENVKDVDFLLRNICEFILLSRNVHLSRFVFTTSFKRLSDVFHVFYKVGVPHGAPGLLRGAPRAPRRVAQGATGRPKALQGAPNASGCPKVSQLLGENYHYCCYSEKTMIAIGRKLLFGAKTL